MKKILLLLTVLLTSLSTWAQTPATYEDGVYKIYWDWNDRGYLAYHDTEYPNEPQLAGVELSGHQTKHYAIDAEGISLSWYLYTSPATGKSYLFEATTGKFITFMESIGVGNGKACSLTTEPTEFSQLDLYATTNTEAYKLRIDYNGTTYRLCSGCGSQKYEHPVRFATDGQSDGGVPFVFVSEGASIEKSVKEVAVAKIKMLELDGEGTEQSPYIIDSSDKLIALGTTVNAGETYAGVYFKLASDIALSGEWTAIGNGTRNGTSYTGTAFKGVFDGANNTISGLTITSTTAADAAIGLFGVVDGGTVKNLNLTNVNINVPSSNLAGAAIGMMLNKATADNITVSGAVVGNDGVGGIVGRMIINGTIANCTNNASVTTSYGGIGGIVGKPYYDNASDKLDFATITNCINNGTITAGSYAGGIAGLARANVTGCVNNGEINGGTQTGGIIGQLIAAGTVSGNENKGKVSGTNHVGGIIGSYTQANAYSYYNVTIANNINRGEIAATQQCAAILGVNNIDGFTAMTATGNQSFYYVEGLELFGNPEDMVIDETNKFVATAKIGEAEYYTFYAAVKAAQVGDVITLLEDADLAFTDNPMYNNIYASEIDLNGKTLTIKEGDLRFDNVTIKNGNIIVEPGLSGGTAVFLMYSKNLTFDAVKITATGCAATYLVGLEGTSNLKLLNGSEILIDNATAIDTDIICSNNGATENTIVIENSKVTVNNIDGRVFFGGNYTVKNSEVSLAGISKAGFRINAGQTLSIEGTSNVNIDGEPRDGGIHLVDITSTYIKEETATVNATINEIPAIAQIGTTKYATLAEAVAAAQNGETITLIGNVELAEVVTIPADKTLTIDLNGKSISMQESIIATAYAINNLGNLTIKDGVGGGSVNARGMYNGYGNGGDNVASAKLTINGGTFNAKGTNGGAAIFNYGIAEVNAGTFTSIGGYSLNNQAGSTMTIAAGVSANNGVYNSNATLTIDGGEISGNRSGCHVIYAWNSTIAINGGTLHNNNSGNATIMSAGTSVVTINGGTISINDGRVPGDNNTWTSCLTDVANTAQIIVNGGTFNGGFRVQAGTSMTINGGSFNDVYGSNYNINGTVTVTGGTFTDDASKNFASTYLAEGYMVAENNGIYTVVQAVAKIGETCYATLEDAFKAATSGCTIDLKKDITVSAAISINKLVTIDLNGKAISSAEGYVFEVTGGELVLQGEGSIGAICYIINDADYKAADKTFALTENKNNVDIVYNRTFGHTSWQVLYVPFAIPVENMEGFEVYSISNVTDSGVVIEQVVEGDLSANTPYIIKATEAGDKTIKVTGATLSVPVAYEETIGNFTINGTYSSMAIGAESQYVLTNGLWCQLSEKAVTDGNNILGAFRVYLTANGENTPSEVRFVINNSDATAIDELKAENGNVKAEVYDLSGRRVEKAVKGIYVVNGVKVIK